MYVRFQITILLAIMASNCGGHQPEVANKTYNKCWEWHSDEFIDADCDHVVDEKDQCPNEIEDIDGFEDEDGCPDNDNDGDGIIDVHDQCPMDHEAINCYLDEDGCPDYAISPPSAAPPTYVTIVFEFGSFALNARAQRALAGGIAELKKDFEEDSEAKLEIVGRAESDEGNVTEKKLLSQKRAEVVYEALIEHGVETNRLKIVALSDKPFPRDRNAKPECKLTNRRVDFRRFPISGINDLSEFKALKNDPRKYTPKLELCGDGLGPSGRRNLQMKADLKRLKEIEAEEKQNELILLQRAIEKELSRREYDYSSLELTDVKRISESQKKIRFTFNRGEDYFVGHATVEDGNVTELQLGTK